MKSRRHEVSATAPKRPRRKSRRCAYCGGSFKPGKRGRPPIFCSPACRQRAYERRHAGVGGPMAALARDIDTVRVRDVIRQEIKRILLEAALLHPQACTKSRSPNGLAVGQRI